jgi:hypothetical protein
MSKILLPLAGAENVLRYDADTGLLYWTVHIYRIKKPGDLAGHMNKRGYIEIRYNRTTYQAHRLAWYLHTGEDPGELQVEHIDTNRTNNRITNLRLATAQDNAQNQSKRKDTTSLYKGVSYYKKSNKWQSQIRANGESIYLGYFDTEIEAHAAYCKAAVELHGEFANFGANSPFNPEDRQFGITPAVWHKHHAKRAYRE